ncbi:MAG: peptidoglycan editing factor PgeF [Corynebacterium casei]|nr:peptidoglycan editing factor PgeF [Corynebacterium casei]MDN5706376.1 peptidoglycan editing factor PgeF [Corynebacterium casei]MDN5728590.1 peptidoglycan editing factor PgeF [Corynebacterium casei]MDN5740025.1 peptidoglycan editing factor PgeF [Corynebacterium casei]MDN5784191.1 peptidoglycan editing factor PgeF [Corynebacterium casei]MDN5799010.1 peptidoglycan editing factor PgeF [Corynebacterium casei]
MPVNEENFRPVRMVFTTRAGGASASPYDSFNLGDHVGDDPEAVAANRQRLAKVTGVDDIIWMEQLHTNTVTVVDKSTQVPVEATDAIVTTTPRLGLGVLVADCVPVLFADTKAHVIAAAHAGRMGARNGIVANTIDKMVELGATPANIQVLLGPAAAGRNYEVPEDMANDVEAHLPGSKTRTTKGTWGVDVRAGLIRQLMSKGVTAIEADPRCTIEDTDFFSYRRQGKTGRQAGLIWLEEEK